MLRVHFCEEILWVHIQKKNQFFESYSKNNIDLSPMNEGVQILESY